MEFTVKTSKREEIVDITEKVKEAVNKLIEQNKRRVCNKDIQACLVYTGHTTCGILINENYDEDVKQDILTFLKENVKEIGWKHAEGNSAAHIKSALIGVSKVIPIDNGKLELGKWQGILFCEFDGPRERKVVVRVV